VGVAFGRRILILAPHPDDEVVGCAAAIGRARAVGAKVGVVFLTHGCVEQSVMWPWERARYLSVTARRRAESVAACALLGVEPVGWADRPARRLWRELPDAEREARRAIADFRADQLWAPAYEGGNPDHDGASALASRFAREGVLVLEFAEYNLFGGKVRSHAFPAPNGTEDVLTLTDDERSLKRRALATYASERGNLGYVATKQEVFRPLVRYDYATSPHVGKLWYARFQWVPFRHPQVDFTKPEAVSRALASYSAPVNDVNAGLTTRAEPVSRLP
jgi:LmbE family N-acetylglucosaminyl deacetylase